MASGVDSVRPRHTILPTSSVTQIDVSFSDTSRPTYCVLWDMDSLLWPTRWNEFLPISMPMTATSLLRFWDMACSFALGAPRQLGPLAGLEHGRTIPLAAVASQLLLHR